MKAASIVVASSGSSSTMNIFTPREYSSRIYLWPSPIVVRMATNIVPFGSVRERLSVRMRSTDVFSSRPEGAVISRVAVAPGSEFMLSTIVRMFSAFIESKFIYKFR